MAHRFSLRVIALIMFFYACKSDNEHRKDPNKVLITEPEKQIRLFDELVALTQGSLSGERLNDSLCFLILPVEAACPSCRKKTIDSIISHKNGIDGRHFVVISGNSRSIIESYFAEQNHKVPNVNGKIFIDSLNQAFVKDLVFTKPAIYHAYNGKVYRKITCVPTNVKGELNKFFGGR